MNIFKNMQTFKCNIKNNYYYEETATEFLTILFANVFSKYNYYIWGSQVTPYLLKFVLENYFGLYYNCIYCDSCKANTIKLKYRPLQTQHNLFPF